MQELKNIIESLLFVSDEPLSMERLKGVLDKTDTKEIRQALEQLNEDYERRGGGFHMREVAGGWQLRSRPEYNEWIKLLLQPSPQRLSKASLETLAIIAYKQPIIRADIEHIRGVDSGGVLRQLMERKLIRVLGRKEIAGRPLIYATTKLFLELFDLKDLKDLPSPKEIAELGAELISGRQETEQEEDQATSPSVLSTDLDSAGATEQDTEPAVDINPLGSDDSEIQRHNELAIQTAPDEEMAEQIQESDDSILSKGVTERLEASFEPTIHEVTSLTEIHEQDDSASGESTPDDDDSELPLQPDQPPNST